MLIVWRDEYCTGVSRIDAQHRMLIDQLNSLYTRIGPDLAPNRILDLLPQFCRCADTHFATEQHLASEAGCALHEFKAHCAEHDDYRNRIEGFRKQIEQRDIYAPAQLMAYLHYWWVMHMLGTDQALGRFLVAKGAQ